MANTTPSPNMNMPVPNVGIDPSPQWASDINACLSVIDGHNHSLGTGVQISPSGLNINADLPFLSNNATLLRSVRFAAQSGAISGPADLGCLYEAGVDLYYNDGSGNQIRITQAGSVTGSSGTITGLPSGTASAAYAAGTFTFQSATNTAATIDAGSYIFRNLTASSHGVTVSPPNSLGSDYNLILPSIPGVTSLMTLDNSGNMAAVTTVDGTTVIISSNMIEVGTIQNGNIAAGGGGGGGGASANGTNSGAGGAGAAGGDTTFNGITISYGASGGNHISGGAVSGPISYAYYAGGYSGTNGSSSQGYAGGGGSGTAGGGAASDVGAGGAAGNPGSNATGNGAGGGGYNNGSTVNGGGGGCVLQRRIFQLTAGASITVVVGAGGAASGSAGCGSDGLVNIYY